jgi:hypothetical protein
MFTCVPLTENFVKRGILIQRVCLLLWPTLGGTRFQATSCSDTISESQDDDPQTSKAAVIAL